MRVHFKYLVPALCAVLVTGCATNYRPLKVDEKSGFYATSTKVDPRSVLAFKTQVNPKQFPVVVLLAEANNRPASLMFTTRKVLAQAGLTKVYSADEFRRLAADYKFDFPEDHFNRDSLAKFSREIAPVLVVDIRHNFLGDANTRTTLVVTDTRSSTNLLVVDHRRLVWTNFDEEALYPVLNQLRQWLISSAELAV